MPADAPRRARSLTDHSFSFADSVYFSYNHNKLLIHTFTDYKYSTEGNCMQMIDNKNQTLYEDLQNTLKAKSKVAIAAG